MDSDLPPLPAIVERANKHYAGEGLADAVLAYAAAAVAAERERCARIVETQDTNGDYVGGWFELLAAAIRGSKT